MANALHFLISQCLFIIFLLILLFLTYWFESEHYYDLKLIICILFSNNFSLSTNNLNNSLNLSNIDRTPASVSPLIRTIIRLWCHEVCRSFYDRLIEGKDKSLFSSTLHSIIMQHFCADIQENFAPSIQGIHVTSFARTTSLCRLSCSNICISRDHECLLILLHKFKDQDLIEFFQLKAI